MDIIPAVIILAIVGGLGYALTRKRKGAGSLPPQGPGNDAEK